MIDKNKDWREIGKGKPADKKVKLRRQELEKLVKKKLLNIGCFCLDPVKIEGRNLENMIGAVQVPLGIVGPLRLRSGQTVKTRDYYIPLATSEGALVASVSRGCKAIKESGGGQVLVEELGTTRGPVFKVSGLVEGKKLINWLEKNFSRIKKVSQQGEKHIRLQRIFPRMVGRNVYVRMEFNTGEAMGMNMVTIASEKIVKMIEKELKIKCAALSGNYCDDKKPSWLNFILGRGKQVWAEVVVDKNTVRKILKTDPRKIVETVYRKQILGSVMSGAMGFNAHYANMVAAIFLATGQDLAHITEGSLGVTTAELTNQGDLYFSVYLPDLMVGTVGGGTQLATQKESLSILGLEMVKTGDALKLAKVIGGTVLAGELSLTAALASNDLAKAHQKLGRGK